jgi:DNA-binding IclR family transcriptional regulator
LKNILQHLKDHGERLDADLAAEIGLSLDKVRTQLTELAAKGDVIMCRTTRYTDGKKIEGMLCRVAGFIPSASPGRKPKTPAN